MAMDTMATATTTTMATPKYQTSAGCKNMKYIFANLVRDLEINKKKTFDIYKKSEGGILHVKLGVFGSNNSKNVNIEKVLSLLESQHHFYLFQEIKCVKDCCVERVVCSLNLSDNKFDGSFIRLDRIGLLMSNGCSYVYEHSDPGNGFLVMVGDEGCTRMLFPDLKSEATLTAK
eukprot:7146620-Ditylum_brightwellii.AAC.1